MTLVGCWQRTSDADEREHRSVFEQMLALREKVMDYQSNSGKSLSSINDIVGSGGSKPECRLSDGRSIAWRFNASSTRNTDWLLAAPLSTEHDGIRGVWVLTKGMTVQVVSPNKLPSLADDPSNNSASQPSP
jgi:hypothetical protein